MKIHKLWGVLAVRCGQKNSRRVEREWHYVNCARCLKLKPKGGGK